MNIYEYQKPLGKIDDAPELRDEFIAVYDTKDKKDMARFCLLYARHLLEITDYETYDEVTRGLHAVEEWLDGKAHYQKARSIGGELYDLAREKKDPVKERFFRTMAQIVCVPHVKYHALWATDFAVTLINRMLPGDLDAVRKERELQIELIKGTFENSITINK